MKHLFEAAALTPERMGLSPGGFIATVTADPTFRPSNGHFTFPQTITIRSSTPTATIFYTTDGSTPTHSSASIASGGRVVLNSAATIKAFAAVSGLADSNIISSPYAAYFNKYVPQGLITGIAGKIGNPNVIYEGNPQILSANPDGNIFKMWYMADAFTRGLLYAESNDGKVWTPYVSNPVIAAGATHAGFGRVSKQGSKYYAYMTTDNGISASTSSNGLSWTLQNATALTATQSWENGKVWQLNVITVDSNGKWWGSYNGGDSGNFFTSWLEGLAVSTDGINWTKPNTGPVIPSPISTGNFQWHTVNGKFYGWSQAVNQTLIDVSIFRFSATNPAGPWVQDANPDWYPTIAAENVGVTGGNLDDPSIVEAFGNVYIYGTKTLNGIAQGVDCAIASNTTFAQLVAAPTGVQNVPMYFTDVNLQTQASDNFIRANANPIGGNWTSLTANTAQLVSNLVEPSSVGVNSDSWWNGFTWDNDQWARVTVAACANSSSFVGVSLRQDKTGVATAYRFMWSGVLGSAGTYYIQKLVNGTATNLATGARTINVGDTITGAIIGTNLYFYHNMVLVRAAVSDSNITGGSGGFALVAGSAVTDAQISAFSGGNFINPALNPIPTSTAYAGAELSELCSFWRLFPNH